MPLSRPRRAPLAGLPLLAMGLAFALALVLPTAARAQSPPIADPDAWVRSIKAEQVRMLMSGPLHQIQENRERAKAMLHAKKHAARRKGVTLKRAPNDVDNTAPTDVSNLAGPSLFGTLQTAGIPTNVMCNSTVGDSAGSGQAEQMIASLGSHVLVAWNDGQGFINPPDIQGYGYSLDGGATFTDGGFVPRVNAGASWTSDPVVTVNEKTGDFYYVGLYNPDASHSGVAVKKATFTSTINWSPEVVAASLSNTSFFIDKEWAVADSSSGNVYLTWTKFTTTADTIMFQRSTDGGLTWSTPLAMSAPTEAGRVQGSRPAVGPNGEVYVVWSLLGTSSQDFAMIRKSVDHGATFGPEAQAAAIYNNFGTGAPGFNRERSVDFPAITVDRTNGPNRGRVYVTWHESVNWFRDFVGTLGNGPAMTTSTSNTAATAFAMTPGQTIRGRLITNEIQWWSFNATQGQTYIFAVDSIPNPFYSVRIFGNDAATRLQFAGVLSAPAGGQSFLVFTAPTTTTFYLRMFWVSGTGSGTGNYRIDTGVHTPGPEPGRDQRDVMIAHSDDGTTWSASSRINDDPAWFDDWLPEVSVGADGLPYAMWFDWRDAAATWGGSSNIYVARSTDGGTTWQPSQKVTTATTPWTTVASNIAPNQGDYNAVYADNRWVRPAWADGRLGTPDVWTTAIDTWFSVAGCPNDTALSPTSVLNGSVTVTNQNPLYSNDYTVQAIPRRSWPSTATPATIAATSASPVSWSLTVPDTAAAGVCVVDVVTRNSTGTLVSTCTFNLTVSAPTAVGPVAASFALEQNRPNPTHGQSTRIEFSLPAAGPVRLEIFSVSGQRVRTLIDGVRSAGVSDALWDGTDDHGHLVHAGTYFYRLTAAGRSAVKRMVVLE